MVTPLAWHHTNYTFTILEARGAGLACSHSTERGRVTTLRILRFIGTSHRPHSITSPLPSQTMVAVLAWHHTNYTFTIWEARGAGTGGKLAKVVKDLALSYESAKWTRVNESEVASRMSLNLRK